MLSLRPVGGRSPGDDSAVRGEGRSSFSFTSESSAAKWTEFDDVLGGIQCAVRLVQ